MKRLLIAALLAGALGFAPNAAAQTPTDFSGAWALDMKKNRNLPPKLEGYTLIVTQKEQRLIVEAKVTGEIKPAAEQDHTTPRQVVPQGAVLPTSSSGGQAGAATSTGESGSAVSRAVMAPGHALALVVPRMSYQLNGQETTTKLEGARPGTVRRKLEWKNNSKHLELFIARDFTQQEGNFTATLREQWELAEGGKVLKLKRTVNLLAGWDEVALIFNKTEPTQR